MLNSVLGKLLSPTQAPQTATRVASAGSGWTIQGGEEREEDGFLLVGESASERSTVLPPHLLHSGNTEAPPTYHSQFLQSSPQPSMQTADSRPWSAHVSAQTLTHHSDAMDECASSPQGSQATSYAFLMMADVPFRLSGELHTAQKLSTDSNYYAVPRLDAYDPNRYFYDFDHERSVLRETSHIAQ